MEEAWQKRGVRAALRTSQSAAASQDSGMSESEIPAFAMLLWLFGGLLFVMLLLVLTLIVRILGRLSRLELLIRQTAGRHEVVEAGPSAAETSAGGAFEAFLSEDPNRRNLPKGEQFSAYRRWRQDNGMNWSNS